MDPSQVIMDHLAAVCVGYEQDAKDLSDTIERAREKVKAVTTADQRAKLLESCRKHPDETYKRSMFAIMSNECSDA